MSTHTEPLSWPLALAPLATGLLIMYGFSRKRRWSDFTLLRRATFMPLKHREKKAGKVKDLRVGESGWVSMTSIVTSKKGRVFVRWNATIEKAPADPNYRFAALQIVRQKRGFGLTVRSDVEFAESPLPWWEYAPVIDVRRSIPDGIPADLHGRGEGSPG